MPPSNRLAELYRRHPRLTRRGLKQVSLTLGLTAVAGVVGLHALPPTANAQATATQPPSGAASTTQRPATRIAVANTVRIFDTIRETQDLKARISAQVSDLDNQSNQRRQALQELQVRRDQLNPGTPQYEDLSNQIRQQSIEFQTWAQVNRAELENEQKRQLQTIYQKIERAVAEHAREQGYDLVLIEHEPQLPPNLDQVTMDQLKLLINQRNVLFAGESVDITDAIVARMDRQGTAR